MSFTSVSLRLPEMEEKYVAYRKGLPEDYGCPLCRDKKTKHEFTHFRIVPNDFPYGKFARIHDMLIPKRHTDEEGFTHEELDELKNIKRNYLSEHYQFIAEASHRHKSIPEHFHLHLIIPHE